MYDEAGQWTQGCITPSGEDNPQWFRALVLEAINDGLTPFVVFDGDDGDNPMGHANAMRQLPILVALLGDLAPFILFGRLWDGVFYGSSPDHIAAFGAAFRRLLPNGYLAIEHQPGRIPVGGGEADYKPGGRMDGYDVVLGEYDTLRDAHAPAVVAGAWDEEHRLYAPVWSDPAKGNALSRIWQVVDRAVRPFHRPANMPMGVETIAQDGPQAGQRVSVSADSQAPPMYLEDSPRGPRFYIVFELGEYEWVRETITIEELRAVGEYFRSMGASYVCLPR